jgi:hypothetical protein
VVLDVEVAGEFGTKLVDRDPGLEQLGLQVSEGLMFHPPGRFAICRRVIADPNVCRPVDRASISL